MKVHPLQDEYCCFVVDYDVFVVVVDPKNLNLNLGKNQASIR